MGMYDGSDSERSDRTGQPRVGWQCGGRQAGMRIELIKIYPAGARILKYAANRRRKGLEVDPRRVRSTIRGQKVSKYLPHTHIRNRPDRLTDRACGSLKM